MNPHRAAAVLAGLWLLVGCVADPQQAKPESPAARSIESRVKASILDAAADAEKRGDNSTALGYYRSAYQQDPTDVAAILGLSRLLRGGSHANEAVTIAERGLEAHKKHPQITAELGKAQLAANDTLKAIETLSLAGTM
jgi:Flp pilus assembly protein TadD